MPTHRTDPAKSDIYELLQRITQQIEVLTDVIERMCDELEWRNNERRNDGERSPPPFVLHSMPIDPTTDDWHLNRVRRNASTQEPKRKERQQQLFEEGGFHAHPSDG